MKAVILALGLIFTQAAMAQLPNLQSDVCPVVDLLAEGVMSRYDENQTNYLEYDEMMKVLDRFGDHIKKIFEDDPRFKRIENQYLAKAVFFFVLTYQRMPKTPSDVVRMIKIIVQDRWYRPQPVDIKRLETLLNLIYCPSNLQFRRH